MNQVLLLSELEQSRQKLDYYSRLKEKQSATKSAKNNPLDKWIEIYSERTGKLERQAKKLGLTVKLAGATAEGARTA